MKSYSQDFITKERKTEYDLCLSPFRAAVHMEKREALEYIKGNGLVSVLCNKDGEIFDTPEKDFQKEWKGSIKDKKKKSLFYRHWQ